MSAFASRAVRIDKNGGPEELKLVSVTVGDPGPGEIRVRVAACGVCRTDLHVLDGDLPDIPLPIIPGHEVVGRIDALGAGVEDLRLGERVGLPWLGHTCGVCPYCVGQQQNLCDQPLFTGYTRDGGSPLRSSPMPALLSLWASRAATRHWRRCCAPG